MKCSIVIIVAAGCSGTGELPSPTPPPPWGAPISGGTMLVSRDGARAVIADPDRDRVMIVDLDGERTTADVALAAGSEPGRIVEDGAGRLHVALRGAGSLLTLDGATGMIRQQRYACSEPRGVAWDAATDLVHVACTGGELVSFAAADGDAVRTVVLDRDLRDVIVTGSQLVVTRFRTAEMITLDASGAIVRRVSPQIVQRVPGSGSGSGTAAEPDSGTGSGSGSGAAEPVDAPGNVAWRTIALPDGSLLMAHQRKSGIQLRTTPGGYTSDCGQGLVESAITLAEPDGTTVAVAPLVRGALPVDVATTSDGEKIAFATAGNRFVHIVGSTQLGERDDNECGTTSSLAQMFDDELGAPTSVAFRPNGELVVFYPELPALVIRDFPANGDRSARTITLPGDVGYDAGRALFHRQTGAGLACASCHPEARDDGQVWDFDLLGPRRTQSLAGGILSRAPYHWGGDMMDLAMLMTNVFGQRMGGGQVTSSELVSLGPWLDRVPAPQASAQAPADAVARGRELFMSAELGCATCHVGPLYTNNAMVDVGTGGTFKVPSLLGVAVRAPYMHDGCAVTLRDRFGTCGGGELHGRTATSSEQQLADLIAFLESL